MADISEGSTHWVDDEGINHVVIVAVPGIKRRRTLLPLSDEHLKAIGKVCFAFATVEATVETAIWGFSEIAGAKATIFTSHTSLKRRLQTFRILGHQKLEDKEAKTTFHEIIDIIRGLESERDNIIHAKWHFSNKANSALAIRVKMRKRDITTAETEMTLEQISDLADRLLNTRLELENFLLFHDAHGVP
jgi:hypothetical protein